MQDKLLRVLLIEDNSGDARLIRKMLAEANGISFEVEVCERLRSGMDRLESEEYDVVLTDLNLPDSSGFDTLEKLLSLSFEPPIVVLTGVNDETVGMKAVEEGAQDYLPKGQVNASLLERSIRYAIERRRTREELRRSEEYHRALIEKSKDMIVVLDVNASILFISPFVENVLGYKPEEVIGRNIFEFVHPDDRQSTVEVFENATKVPGKPYSIECRVAHKNGSWRYIESIGVNHLENPYINGVVLNSRHVTERKALEQALSRKEKHFRSLIENAYDVTLVMNEDGNIRFASPYVKQVSGYEAAELEGKNAFAYIHPDDMDEIVEVFTSSIQESGMPDYMQFRFRHKDGSWRMHEGVFRNLMRDPAVDGMVLNYRDVTEHAWLVDTLKSSERHYRALIENAYDAVLITDKDGTQRFMNPSVKHVTGYEAEELEGNSIFEYIHPDDLPAFMRVFSNVIRKHGDIGHAEYRFHHKDGTWRAHEAACRNLLHDPDVAGVIINYRDIGDRKLLEEELRNLSLTDDLTGLNNRRGFFTLAEQYMKIAKRQKRPFSLLFCDLDGLKQINDTFGHQVGGQALTETADVLRETFRESDILTRIGGDEFVVLATDASRGDMDVILDRLAKNVEKHNADMRRPYKLSISCGISYFDPDEPESLEGMISQADAAMYEQKRDKYAS